MKKNTMTFKISLALLFATFTVLLVQATGNGGAEGRTITVDDDGEGNHTKIQDAINAAEEGDTIRVWEGSYEENVVVGKTVSLVGNGSGVTTVDGGGSGTVVIIEADWVNMSGFLVTRGGDEWGEAGIYVNSDYGWIYENYCSNNGENGIRVQYSNYNTLENNTCSNNGDDGIDIVSNHNIIENNSCFDNDEYGIFLGSSENNTIRNNTCSNNQYGISIMFDSEYNTLIDNVCSNNRKAGIWLYSDNNEAKYNICSNNGRDGMLLQDCSYNKITGNNCSGNKYGIFLYHSHQNTITNNEGSGNRVGIKLEKSDDNTLSDNVFSQADGGDDDGGFLPGFELVVLVGAFGVVWHIKRKRN